MAMAWIFVLSPNIGWLNLALKSVFGLSEAPVSIYSMAGMIWALASHYFPLAYLSLGPALRVLDTRMEEAAVVSGARYWQMMVRSPCRCCGPPSSRRYCCCSCLASLPMRCRV